MEHYCGIGNSNSNTLIQISKLLFLDFSFYSKQNRTEGSLSYDTIKHRKKTSQEIC